MSKIKLTQLAEDIKKDPFQGTGRQGYYLDSYMLLMDKMDDLKAQDDIRVDELGPSGDGKVPFEFRVYPMNGVPFAVYPYKFDPTNDPEVRDGKIFHFSVSGPVGSIDSAKKYLGDGVLSNQEYQEGLDQLSSSGDTLEETPEDLNEAELAPTGIGISQEQLDDLKRLGAISGLEVYVQDKDGSNVRKVNYTLTNTDFVKDDDDIDYVNESDDSFGHDWLKRHAGLK